MQRGRGYKSGCSWNEEIGSLDFKLEKNFNFENNVTIKVYCAM